MATYPIQNTGYWPGGQQQLGGVPQGMPGPIGAYQGQLQQNFGGGGAYDATLGRYGAMAGLDPSYFGSMQAGFGANPNSISGVAGQTQGRLGQSTNRAMGRNPMAAYGQYRQGIKGLQNPYQDALRGALDPSSLDVSSNPAVQGAIRSATDPMVEAFERTTDPNLRSAYGSLGQYGSSRHQLDRGQAIGDLTKNIGQVAGSMSLPAYQMQLQNQQQARAQSGGELGQAASSMGQLSMADLLSGRGTAAGLSQASAGLDYGNLQNTRNQYGGQMNQMGLGLGGMDIQRQQTALGMYPGAINLGMLPGQIQAGIGAERRAEQDRYLQEPYNRLGMYNQIVQPNAGLGGQTTLNQGGIGGNPWLAALGGGMQGYGDYRQNQAWMEMMNTMQGGDQ